MKGKTRKTVAALAALAVLVQGCATPPPPQRAIEPLDLGAVSIVAAGTDPEIRFEGFAHGRGEGALTGAGATFAGCAAGLGHGACSGPLCGAVVILWLGICGVASAVGGVAGAAASQDAATVRAAESRLQTAISARTVQEALREQVAAIAGERLGARKGEPDTLLETSLVRVGTTGSGWDMPIQLRMEAKVRILKAADRSVVREEAMTYLGERRRLAEWSKDNGTPLLEGLRHGYEVLATEIYDAVFRLYPFPGRDFQGAGFLTAAFGLAPESPKMRGSISGEGALKRRFEWPEVESLRPTLRWQAFPRAADFAKAPEEMGRVRAVSYDLVVAREEGLAAGQEVYRRERLARPAHTLEEPLEPHAYYFWSVRARFELDGREWVTEWSTTNWFAFGKLATPSSWSYRFRTP
jgi:hypothetical protein